MTYNKNITMEALESSLARTKDEAQNYTDTHPYLRSLKTCVCTRASGSSNIWGKVATTIPIDRASTDYTGVFLVQNTFSSKNTGILVAHIRTGADKTITSNQTWLQWMINNDATYTLNNYALVYKEGMVGNCVELWVKNDYNYAEKSVTLISSNSRNSEGWHDMWEMTPHVFCSNETLPEGYNVVYSTFANTNVHRLRIGHYDDTSITSARLQLKVRDGSEDNLDYMLEIYASGGDGDTVKPFVRFAGWEEGEGTSKYNNQQFNLQNIAIPILDSDAANKIYVDTSCKTLSNQIKDLEARISSLETK